MEGEVQGWGWSDPTNFQDRGATERIASFATSRKETVLSVIKKTLGMKESVLDAPQEHMHT